MLVWTPQWNAHVAHPVAIRCPVNVDATCLVQKAWVEDENGPSYYESGGTVCECTNGFDSKNVTTILSCMDTQCPSCNDNRTVFSMNEH
jgi:hypothetical protein